MSTSISVRRCAAIVVLSVVACTGTPTPVTLQGTPSDIAALAGRWEGQYSSTQTGRSGSIVFTIRAGTDTAFGDVLMVPEPGLVNGRIVAADAATGEHARHSRAAELLRVSFVRVSGGFIDGTMEPYIAPDCNCTVTTTFRGTQRGDRVAGDYLTTGVYGLRQTGQWSVTRTQKEIAP